MALFRLHIPILDDVRAKGLRKAVADKADDLVTRVTAGLNASALRSGSRSHRNTSRRGCAWPLTARLTSKTAGPVTPKCVNNSAPRRWAR